MNKRQQRQHRDLRSEGLGRRDADLGTGMQINAAVGFAGDRAADHVADARAPDAPAFGFAQAGQRVGRFAGLRDGEHQRVLLNRRIAVAELAGVFDLGRDMRELLEQIFADQCGMPAGAAGGDDDVIDRAQFGHASCSARRIWRCASS